MYTKNLGRKLGGFILALLLLPGLALFSAGTVEAQGRHGGFRHGGRVVVVRPFGFGRGFGRPYWGYGDPYWGYPGYGFGYYSHYIFKDDEDAYKQGYSDGVKTGSDDAKKHKSNDPVRSHYYHDSGFGNFGETYRDGFNHGYSDGYEGKK
jgi:hypothetical protein